MTSGSRLTSERYVSSYGAVVVFAVEHGRSVATSE